VTETKPCERCGKLFARGPKQKPGNWRKKRFCSISCAKDKGRRNLEPYPADPRDIVTAARDAVRRCRVPGRFAEDFTQEACVNGYLSLWYYDESLGIGLPAYLAFVMGKRIRRMLAALGKSSEPESVDTGFDGLPMPLEDHRSPQPDLVAESHERADMVNAAMARMPVQLRDFLRYSAVDDMPDGMVGQMMGFSREWARQKICQAKRLMRSELEAVA